MAASPAVIRSYRGHFLWLILQYLACLTVGNDDSYGEQWPVMFLVVIWLTSELVAKFSWKLNRRSSGSLAQGLEICYVLAGLVFQKALFVSHSVLQPSERAVSQVIAGASKLSFIFFCLPIGELVLLLLVDSLLQMLVFNQYANTRRDLSCDVSLLLLADALFTALPLLLHCFRPWRVEENRAVTDAKEGGKGQEGAYPAEGLPATASPLTTAATKGAVCRHCGDEVILNRTCPVEVPTCRLLESRETRGRQPTVHDCSIKARDRSCHGGEPSVERLLVSLVVLLLKRNSGNRGEPHSLFDGTVTPPDADGLGKEVQMSSGRQPCREKGETNKSTSGRGAGTSNTSGSAASHSTPCDRGRTQNPQGPKPVAVSPAQRAVTPEETRDNDAAWTCYGLCGSVRNATSRQPLLHNIYTPSTAERSSISVLGSPIIDLLEAPHNSHTQAVSWATDNRPLTATESTRHEQSSGYIPVPLRKAYVEGASQSLLTYLKEQTAKANHERSGAATGVLPVAVPIAPGVSLRPLSAAAASPAVGMRKRASSQPPPEKATRNVVLNSSVAPRNLQVNTTLRPEQHTITDSRRPSCMEGYSSYPLDKGLAMVIQALHQPKQGDAERVVLVGRPQGAFNTEGAAAAAAAARAIVPQLLTSHICPRAKENGSGSRAARTPDGYTNKMNFQREQVPLLEETGQHTQQLRVGLEGGQLHHEKQQLQIPMQHQMQQQQQLQHAAQHAKQHQPGMPLPARRSRSREDKEGGRQSPTWRPLVKVLGASVEPVVPTMLQQVTPPKVSRGRAPPAPASDISNKNCQPESGVVSPQTGGLAEDASSAHRISVLDPFAAVGQQPRGIPPIVWGRSKAIGANGTPMISPRKRDRPSSLGPGRSADTIRVQRLTPMPSGSERHSLRSPTVSVTPEKGNAVRGGGGGLVGEKYIDRGECMDKGSRHFFGGHSLSLDSATPQVRQKSSNAEQAHQNLLSFAMWRRGRPTDTSGLTPSPQPSTTTRADEPSVPMQGEQRTNHGDRDKPPSGWNAATAPNTENREEGGLEGKSPAATPGALMAEGPSVLIWTPGGEGSQLLSPQPPSASSSRLSSNSSPRPIDPGCPRHVTPRAAGDAAERREHPPARGHQQPVRVANSSTSSNSSSRHSWEGWVPLLQGEAAGFPLSTSEQQASRQTGEGSAGAQAPFCNPRRQSLQ